MRPPRKQVAGVRKLRRKSRMFTDKFCDRIRRFMTPLVSVANQARCDSRDRSDDGAPQLKPEAPGLQESKANFSRKLKWRCLNDGSRKAPKTTRRPRRTHSS